MKIGRGIIEEASGFEGVWAGKKVGRGEEGGVKLVVCESKTEAGKGSPQDLGRATRVGRKWVQKEKKES